MKMTHFPKVEGQELQLAISGSVRLGYEVQAAVSDMERRSLLLLLENTFSEHDLI